MYCQWPAPIPTAEISDLGATLAHAVHSQSARLQPPSTYGWDRRQLWGGRLGWQCRGADTGQAVIKSNSFWQAREVPAAGQLNASTTVTSLETSYIYKQRTLHYNQETKRPAECKGGQDLAW